ncbi:MAG: PAS domain S-box protein [Candidatus Heimdallarchaeota archaeon]
MDIVRKQVKALQESEKKYYTLFETVRDAIYITTRDGKFVDFNPALVELFGYPRNELFRLNANDLYVYSVDRLQFQQEIEQKDTVKDYEVKLKKKDGTIMDCLLTSTVRRSSDGRILGYQGIIRDITESKRAEKLIQASERRFYTLFGNSPVSITLLDPTGVIIDSNNATENLIGYTKEEIIGKSFGNLSTLDPKDLPKLQDNYQKLAQGSEVEPYELEIIRKDGTRRWITVSHSLLMMGDVVEGIQIIANDITDRKRTEAALRKSEKQLRAQYKGIPIPTYTWQWVGDDFKLVNYNNAAVVITEGNVTNFIGKAAKEMFHDRPDVQEDIFNCFTNKITIKREMLYRFTFQKSKYLAVSYVFVPPDLVMIHTEDITERKQAEAALQESEAKYSALVEYATDGVAIIQDGVFQFANQAAAELSGYSIDKLVGRPFLDLLTPESRDLLTQRYQLRMADETVPSVYEAKIQRKDGTLKDVEISAGIIQYQGRPADMAIARDITTRKLAEEELHKLSRAVEQSPSIVMITDTQGIIEYVNPKFTQITGYPPEDIIGINARDLGEQLSEVEQQMWNTICSGNEWRGEFLNKKKNGDLYWEHASISPIKNREGVITHFLKVAENITAQKQVEEALRASEERYRSLFEESPISLWEEDFSAIKQYIDNLRDKGVKDFRIYFEKHPEAVAQCAALAKVVDVNKMTLEMYEARNKEELLKGLNQVFGEETYNVFQAELISLTEGKTVFDSEAINQTLTGNKLHIHLRWSVAPGYEDTWKKILISILDITSHKQAEVAKREFEESQTNFIEITSHELRTPLTAIRGYTEFLNKHLDELDQASRNQSFEMINRNIQRLERLIKGVSTLGQLERGVFRLDTKKVNFCDIINEALQPYQTRLGQQLEYQSCPDKMSVIITVDPDRLLQIIDNLLENAVKQTPQDQRKIIVTPEILPNIIRVQVADNGAGIAPEDLDNIFKPFKAIPTKYSAGGTGIGLYLARMLAEAHGGTLTAHSGGKGKGATFILEFRREPLG